MERLESVIKEGKLLDERTTLEEQQPLMKILSEYEEVNRGLTSLVELYEKEHGAIRSESVTLIEENKRLGLELKEALEPCPENNETHMIANLKQQLTLTVQEKNAALELWKLSVGEVSNLEKLLKIFQDKKESGYNSSSYEISNRLEKARALEAAEIQIVELRAQVAKERLLRAEVESKMTREREAHASLSHQLDAVSLRLQHSEEESAKHFKCQQQETQQILELTRQRDDLQRTFEHSKNRLQNALAQAEEGRQRVSEALTLVDSACVSRDQAAAGEAKAKEEVVRLQSALKELTEEAGSRVKREVEQIKQQCNARIQTVLVDMKKIQEEVAEQRSLADRGMRGQKQAEEALERKTLELRTAQARQLPLETRLATLHAQFTELERRLLSSETTCEALQRELASERDNRKREDNGAEGMKWALEKKVSALAMELEESRRQTNEINQRMNLREHHLVTRLQTVERSSMETITELQQIVSAHQSISEKCQAEMHNMAEKFSGRLKEMRGELMRLRSERDEAHRQLQHLKAQPHLTPRNGVHHSVNGKSRPKSLFMDC